MPQQSTAQFDSAVGLVAGGHGHRSRHYLFENFLHAPGVNADVVGTTTLGAITNRQFEIVGTNAVSADSLLDDNGGIKITTNGGGADQAIIVPHVDASQSGWSLTNGVVWDTDQAPAVEFKFKTDSSIADMIYYQGFVMTNPATYAVSDDADRVVIDYNADSSVNSGKFRLAYSVAGTDYTHDFGLTVTASTTYIGQIFIREDRYVDAFIGAANDMGAAKHVRTANKMTANIATFIPTFAIEETTGSAKTAYLRYVAAGINTN